MTDVCIATELLIDAYKNKFDTALIISGDSDLALNSSNPEIYPNKKYNRFPPSRISARLKHIAHASFIIGEANLRKSLFPNEIIKNDGYILKRPDKWR